MKRNRNFIPILATSVLILGSGVGLELLFNRYMYLPLFMLAQLLFLLGISTVLLALFSLIPPPAESVEKTETEETAAEETAVEERTKPSPLAAVGGFFRSIGRGIRRFFGGLWQWICRRSGLLVLLALIAVFALAQWRFIPSLRRFTESAQIGYGTALALLIGSFVCIIFDKLCRWAYLAIPADAEGKEKAARATLHNLRLTLKLARFCALCCAAVAVLKLTGLWDGQRALTYGMIVVWAYCSLFYVISLISRTIRRELHTNPCISIPLPLMKRDADDDLQILSHLEANTGITFRSLWSLRFIKKILPYVAMLTVLFFWLSTGVVQIESYEEGARYRFGRLEQEDILGPGLHLTLPWPLDKVEVYDTGHIRELTLGYEADRQSDNLWTEEHGSNEYRLLLGEGNELVSINMRLEYVVDDLWQYITTSADPVSRLSAEAYELITAETIAADLDTMLSVDRSAFSVEFCRELNEVLSADPIGLTVRQVVIESIHPPVEIAPTYQNVVSAEIDAEAIVWEAEAQAAVKLATAEAVYVTLVKSAEADYHDRVAAAEAEVTEFMAAVAADGSHRDAYRYYRYLNALQTTLKGSRLYILGEHVDAGSIYLGGGYVMVGSAMEMPY